MVGQVVPDYVGLGIRNVDDVVLEAGVSFVNEVRERFARPLRRLTRAPLILGREKLLETVSREIVTRPNCVRSSESTPPPTLLREAVRLRKAPGLAEPMFWTLLRLRRQAGGA